MATKDKRDKLYSKKRGKKVQFSRLESCFRSNNGRLTSREIPLARMYCCGFQISSKTYFSSNHLGRERQKKKREHIKAKLKRNESGDSFFGGCLKFREGLLFLCSVGAVP